MKLGSLLMTSLNQIHYIISILLNLLWKSDKMITVDALKILLNDSCRHVKCDLQKKSA